MLSLITISFANILTCVLSANFSAKDLFTPESLNNFSSIPHNNSYDPSFTAIHLFPQTPLPFSRSMSILYSCSFPPSEITFNFLSDNSFLREHCFHLQNHILDIIFDTNSSENYTNLHHVTIFLYNLTHSENP